MTRRIFTFLILPLLLVALILFWSTPEEYVARQVKAMPNQAVIENSQNLINYYPHLRFAKRPDEVFAFPIEPGNVGPVAPLYAGPNQYPFYCMTLDSELGQPLVDNQEGWGVPVYDDIKNIGKEDHIVGYSKDCSIRTRTFYIAETDAGVYERFDTQPDVFGRYLYRVERGTINRYIYTLVMPITATDVDKPAHSSRWNKKLIYQFQGGSGIGFRQGRARLNRLLTRRSEQLHNGYAVITSTGNRTSYTYNMLLAEDTARRVKKQFTSQYGEPDYTVGIGGSGGGLSQYLIGQNSSGILDAAIPLYSYPDMVSQTLYGLDCDLLNNYYSYRSDVPDFWQDWENRELIEGLNAANGETHFSSFLEPINQILAGRWPRLSQGNSECINGWFGLSTFVHNPAQGFLREFFANEVSAQTHWTYWQDLINIFGQDEAGFANATWSNEGVQYGLEALKQGKISSAQFIHLNWHIGSWKPADEMQPELLIGGKNKRNALWLSMWSRHNITRAGAEGDDVESDYKGSDPAQRLSANASAIESAYRSGQIFIGHIEIPIIDVRHYLEDKLDMHHSSASFSARLRIQNALHHHRHHIIWIAHEDHSPVNEAFVAMDKWLQNRKANPRLNAWQSKPQDIQDQCTNPIGKVIARGNGVWDGAWNNKEPGACQQIYPTYKTSRIQAGSHWRGDIFKCSLMSVESAIASGIYGEQDMTHWSQTLKKIFPNGVCDYSQPDAARPRNI